MARDAHQRRRRQHLRARRSGLAATGEPWRTRRSARLRFTADQLEGAAHTTAVNREGILEAHLAGAGSECR